MKRYLIPNTKGGYELIETNTDVRLYSNLTNRFLKDCHGGYRSMSEREHYVIFYDENEEQRKEVVKLTTLINLVNEQGEKGIEVKDLKLF